jgi:hypothetical protein
MLVVIMDNFMLFTPFNFEKIGYFFHFVKIV